MKLILVLGHSGCGAVGAAIDVVERGTSYPAATHGEIGAVLEPIIPVVRSLPRGERDSERCVAANARHEARRLAGLDPIIAPRVAAGELAVVPAVYEIGSGLVSVLD